MAKKANMMEQRLNKDGIKYLCMPFFWTLLMTASFFLAAGRLDIFRAWLAFGIHFMGAAAGVILMWKFAPGLANQRATAKAGTKNWDKAILLTYFLLVLLVIPLTAGFDVGRFGWSSSEMDSISGGIVFYAAFFFLFHWAILSNEHFEGTARIQADRGHRVITNGPYRIVRHPGYVAMIFAGLADPLIIGSWYALIPGALAILVTILRTFLEDRMLHNELEGYATYAGEVRYRLIPGVW